MKKVLVLGAGLVARPLVRYLLERTDYSVCVIDKFLNKAQSMVTGQPRGTAYQLDVTNTVKLAEHIKKSDLVVSLLPWALHPKVADLCLEYGSSMVTTSYVKDEMRALHDKAKAKGLIFLNEIGFDPGIDHMIAVDTINKIKNKGGRILEFNSYGSSIPAEDSNNPMGYKFSWSPKGFLRSTLNDGRYLKDGEIINIKEQELFKHYWLVEVPGIGVFESYVNRDALKYKKLYGIESTKTLLRGTLRYIGMCETWTSIKKLGLLCEKRVIDTDTLSPREMIKYLIKSNGEDLLQDISSFLNIPVYSTTIKKLEWLGLLSPELLSIGEVTIFDMFGYLLNNKLQYRSGERDLVILYQEFLVEHHDKRREKRTLKLELRGLPEKESAIAQTVGLPAAIAVKCILEEDIKQKGVHIPILEDIYNPILKELEALGVKIEERNRFIKEI